MAMPPFRKFLRVHVRTDPGNVHVKFEVHSFNVIGASNAQQIYGSRDPGHAHLGALLYINFVVLLRLKLCVKFEVLSLTVPKINRGYQIIMVTSPWPHSFQGLLKNILFGMLRGIYAPNLVKIGPKLGSQS